MIFTADELAVKGAFPPLHPHCGCYLATMDGKRVRNEKTSAVTNNIIQDEAGMFDAFFRIPQDARTVWDAYLESQLERNRNKDKGIPEFLDWFTYGIFSGMFNASRERVEAMQDDPNWYTIGNWATSGLFGTINGTFFPEEPLSLEHWMNSLGTAAVVYAAYASVQKSMAIGEPPKKLPDRMVQAPKGAFEGANATADVRKFSDYIFKEGAAPGKDVVFNNLGYTADDSRFLVNLYQEQALAKYTTGNYALGRLDGFGQRINIEIELVGIGSATGKTSYI